MTPSPSQKPRQSARPTGSTGDTRLNAWTEYKGSPGRSTKAPLWKGMRRDSRLREDRAITTSFVVAIGGGMVHAGQ